MRVGGSAQQRLQLRVHQPAEMSTTPQVVKTFLGTGHLSQGHSMVAMELRATLYYSSDISCSTESIPEMQRS